MTGPIWVSHSSGSPTRILPTRSTYIGQELVVDRPVQEEAGTRGATLASIGEDREQRPVNRFVQIRVREDDVRALAAQFEGDVLDGAGSGAHDLAAGLGFAGKGDLVDERMRG